MNAAISTEIVKLVMTLLVMVIVSLLGMAYKKVSAYMSAKIGVAKWEDLKQRASTVVTYLAQCPATEMWEGPQKKQYTLVDLFQYAAATGIKVVEDASLVAMGKAGLVISHEDLDKIAEEAYGNLKIKLAGALTPPTAPAVAQ